jgi:hypothetical protein
MTDAAPVVTELVVTSDNEGAVDYARAMAAAQVAAAAAMVANDNFSNSMRSANDNARDAAESHSHLTVGLKHLAESALEAAEAWAKKVAIGVTVVTFLGTLARVLFPLYTIYKLITTAIGLVTEAWSLGNAKLAEHVALAEKAGQSSLSTDFFQRIQKAAEDAKLPIDELTAAMKKLNDSFAPKLGGNDAMNRLDALVKAGNFKGNSGVADIRAANDPEERFNAVAKTIREAMDAGQRLAALDLSKTFLGDAVTANLAKDSDYLDKMKATIESTKASELVSAADIGRATDLQNRLDAAEKILSQRWHPIQDLLTQGGIAMKGIWVDIVEIIAKGVDGVAKLIEKLAAVPAWFSSGLRYLSGAAAAIGPALPGPVGAVIGVGGRLAGAGLSSPDPTNPTGDLMKNPANISRARDYANNVLNNVHPDTSFNPDAKKITETKDAYDRAEESLLKYIETTKAAAESAGQGAEQQERLRAIAQLTAAGIKDGLTPAAAKAKAEMSGLAEQAAQAAQALAKAKIAADIKFNRDTAFLSQEDVQIASQLKSIYPDVAMALGSVEAQGIRANNAFREISSTIDNNLTSGLTDMTMGTKTVSQGFGDMASSFARAIEQMIIKIMIVQPLLQSLQSLMNGGLGGLGISLPGVGSSALTGQDAAFNASLFPGYGTAIGANAAGTDYWRGGLTEINERGGEIMDLPNGTRIIPHDVSMAMAAGNDNRSSTVNLYLIEDSSRAGQVEQKQNASGGTDLNAFVDSITARNATKPGSQTSRALDQRNRLASR